MVMKRLTRRQFGRSGIGMTFAVGSAFGLASRPAQAAEFTLKYANSQALQHPLNVAAAEMAKRIEDDTKGRVAIKIFPSSQLGGDTEMLSQLRSGAIDCFALAGPILAGLVPLASIEALGFAFNGHEQLWHAMDGDLGAMVRADIAKSGLVVMDTVWENGFRKITSGVKPVLSADDLVGFKIRVPVGPLWVSMFRALGAAPTSMNFNELYTALQTRAVDGQENPLINIESGKLYEVQKYCSLTDHMWTGYWFMANPRSWARMPTELRDVVRENINKAGLRTRELTQQQDIVTKKELEEKGMVFVTPDRASFREKLKSTGFYSDWRTKFGQPAWTALEKYADGLGQ